MLRRLALEDPGKFAKLQKALLPGDTVVVTKLDRLARSSRDLHNIVHELEGLSCGFVSLGESWCDTTTDAGRLMLTIMGGIAEFERGLIRKRTDEGIERARKLGKRFGRPERLDDGQKRKIADFLRPARRSPSWLRNTSVASALFGGHFNPKSRQPRKKKH